MKTDIEKMRIACDACSLQFVHVDMFRGMYGEQMLMGLLSKGYIEQDGYLLHTTQAGHRFIEGVVG